MFKRFLTLSLLTVSFSAHAEINIDSSAFPSYMTSEEQQQLAQLNNNRIFEQFMPGSVAITMSTMFTINDPMGEIAFTSYEQADACFDLVRKLIGLKIYNQAAFGLEMLICSITSGKLPYNETKFEAYKQAFISLASTCGMLPYGAQESDLIYTAQYVIEYFSEKQHNPETAKSFARQVIEQANKAIDSDFLFSMLDTWCKYHQIKGSLPAGFDYVESILAHKARNPGMNEIFFTSPAEFLTLFFDYSTDVTVAIAKCPTIIDLLLTFTFTTLATYAHQHEREILDYVDSILLILQDKEDSKEKMKWRQLRKNGIDAIIGESQKRLVCDIARIAKKIARFMMPAQEKIFFDDINAKLRAKGCSDISEIVDTRN